MTLDLTPNQLQKLQSLGINTSSASSRPESSVQNLESISPIISLPQDNTVDQKLPLPPSSSKATSNSALPLLSISGLTLLSFGGLLLFKSKESPGPIISSPESSVQNQESSLPTPTQVPKSIQHYLLTSQQYFSQALSLQTQDPAASNTPQLADLLNQSLLAATDAIKDFPQDYRGYQQRGRIYQALIDSQPQLLPNALSDFSSAQKLNPASPELTHDLALLFAKKGDAASTISYLQQTLNLEPTKAQNFYDLAQIQQQVGLIPQALSTYTRLLPLITDPNQKTTVNNQIAALQSLLSQNPNPSVEDPGSTIQNPTPTVPLVSPNAPTLQASLDSQLVIAAPETDKNVSLAQQTASNSLSGDLVLPANQTSITLSNTHITSLSKVYLTITKGGKNLILQVLSKTTGQAVIGLDSPTNEDIQFKWWIIEP